MFYVIGNVYNNDGFVWIECDGSLPSDLWKYSKHGVYETWEKAAKVCDKINKKLGNEINEVNK